MWTLVGVFVVVAIIIGGAAIYMYLIRPHYKQWKDERKAANAPPVPEGFEDIYNSHIDKIRSNSVFGDNPLHQQQQMRSHHPLGSYSVHSEEESLYHNHDFSTATRNPMQPRRTQAGYGKNKNVQESKPYDLHTYDFETAEVSPYDDIEMGAYSGVGKMQVEELAEEDSPHYKASSNTQYFDKSGEILLRKSASMKLSSNASNLAPVSMWATTTGTKLRTRLANYSDELIQSFLVSLPSESNFYYEVTVLSEQTPLSFLQIGVVDHRANIDHTEVSKFVDPLGQTTCLGVGRTPGTYCLDFVSTEVIAHVDSRGDRIAGLGGMSVNQIRTCKFASGLRLNDKETYYNLADALHRRYGKGDLHVRKGDIVGLYTDFVHRLIYISHNGHFTGHFIPMTPEPLSDMAMEFHELVGQHGEPLNMNYEHDIDHPDREAFCPVITALEGQEFYINVGQSPFATEDPLRANTIPGEKPLKQHKGSVAKLYQEHRNVKEDNILLKNMERDQSSDEDDDSDFAMGLAHESLLVRCMAQEAHGDTPFISVWSEQNYDWAPISTLTHPWFYGGGDVDKGANPELRTKRSDEVAVRAAEEAQEEEKNARARRNSLKLDDHEDKQKSQEIHTPLPRRSVAFMEDANLIHHFDEVKDEGGDFFETRSMATSVASHASRKLDHSILDGDKVLGSADSLKNKVDAHAELPASTTRRHSHVFDRHVKHAVTTANDIYGDPLEDVEMDIEDLAPVSGYDYMQEEREGKSHGYDIEASHAQPGIHAEMGVTEAAAMSEDDIQWELSANDPHGAQRRWSNIGKAQVQRRRSSLGMSVLEKMEEETSVEMSAPPIARSSRRRSTTSMLRSDLNLKERRSTALRRQSSLNTPSVGESKMAMAVVGQSVNGGGDSLGLEKLIQGDDKAIRRNSVRRYRNTDNERAKVALFSSTESLKTPVYFCCHMTCWSDSMDMVGDNNFRIYLAIFPEKIANTGYAIRFLLREKHEAKGAPSLEGRKEVHPCLHLIHCYRWGYNPESGSFLIDCGPSHMRGLDKVRYMTFDTRLGALLCNIIAGQLYTMQMKTEEVGHFKPYIDPEIRIAHEEQRGNVGIVYGEHDSHSDEIREQGPSILHFHERYSYGGHVSGKDQIIQANIRRNLLLGYLVGRVDSFIETNRDTELPRSAASIHRGTACDDDEHDEPKFKFNQEKANRRRSTAKLTSTSFVDYVTKTKLEEEVDVAAVATSNGAAPAETLARSEGEISPKEDRDRRRSASGGMFADIAPLSEANNGAPEEESVTVLEEAKAPLRESAYDFGEGSEAQESEVILVGRDQVDASREKNPPKSFFGAVLSGISSILSPSKEGEEKGVEKSKLERQAKRPPPRSSLVDPRILAFYAKYDPKMLDTLPHETGLVEYAGREDEILTRLHEKYNVPLAGPRKSAVFSAVPKDSKIHPDILEFYETYAPEVIPELPHETGLVQYEGREDEVLIMLHEQYGIPVPLLTEGSSTPPPPPPPSAPSTALPPEGLVEEKKRLEEELAKLQREKEDHRQELERERSAIRLEQLEWERELAEKESDMRRERKAFKKEYRRQQSKLERLQGDWQDMEEGEVDQHPDPEVQRKLNLARKSLKRAKEEAIEEQELLMDQQMTVFEEDMKMQVTRIKKQAELESERRLAQQADMLMKEKMLAEAERDRAKETFRALEEEQVLKEADFRRRVEEEKLSLEQQKAEELRLAMDRKDAEAALREERHREEQEQIRLEKRAAELEAEHYRQAQEKVVEESLRVKQELHELEKAKLEEREAMKQRLEYELEALESNLLAEREAQLEEKEREMQKQKERLLEEKSAAEAALLEESERVLEALRKNMEQEKIDIAAEKRRREEELQELLVQERKEKEKTKALVDEEKQRFKEAEELARLQAEARHQEEQKQFRERVREAAEVARQRAAKNKEKEIASAIQSYHQKAQDWTEQRQEEELRRLESLEGEKERLQREHDAARQRDIQQREQEEHHFLEQQEMLIDKAEKLQLEIKRIMQEREQEQENMKEVREEFEQQQADHERQLAAMRAEGDAREAAARRRQEEVTQKDQEIANLRQHLREVQAHDQQREEYDALRKAELEQEQLWRDQETARAVEEARLEADQARRQAERQLSALKKEMVHLQAMKSWQKEGGGGGGAGGHYTTFNRELEERDHVEVEGEGKGAAPAPPPPRQEEEDKMGSLFKSFGMGGSWVGGIKNALDDMLTNDYGDDYEPEVASIPAPPLPPRNSSRAESLHQSPVKFEPQEGGVETMSTSSAFQKMGVKLKRRVQRASLHPKAQVSDMRDLTGNDINIDYEDDAEVVRIDRHSNAAFHRDPGEEEEERDFFQERASEFRSSLRQVEKKRASMFGS